MISELSKKIESLKMLQKEANEQKKQSYSHVNNKDAKITELTNKLNIQTDVNKQQEKKLAEMEKKIWDFKSNQKKANSQPKSKETINQPKFFGSEDKGIKFYLIADINYA